MSTSMSTRMLAFVLLLSIMSLNVVAVAQPVSWWTFNNNNTLGTTSIDVVSGNNGTLRGGVLTNRSGKIGQAYGFDGTNDDVQIPDSALYDFTELSIEAWIFMNTTCGGKNTIFGTKGASVEWELIFDCAAGQDIEWRIDSSPSGATTLSDSGGHPKTGYHHVVVTATLLNMTIYFNGTSTGSLGIVKLGNYNAEDFIYVGSDDGGANFNFGLIDEVKLYNRSLSASEVLELYNNGSGVPFVLPNQPPSTPVIVAPSNGTLIADLSPIEWTRSIDPDGNNITYALYLLNGTTHDVISLLSNNTGNLTLFDPFNLSDDGNYSFQVNATDGTFIVDSGITTHPIIAHTPSNVSILTPINGSIVSNIVNVSWFFDADIFATGHTFITQIRNSSGGLVNQNISINGTRSVLWNTDLFPDGLYTIRTNVTHTAGGRHNTSQTIIVFTDNTPPVLTLSYPSNPLNWGNGTIRGFCTDASPMTFSYATNLSPAFITNISLDPSSFLFRYNNTNLTTPHSGNISLVCTDIANNSVSDVRVYNFDLQSPFCLGITPLVAIDEGDQYQWNLTCMDESNYFSLNISCSGGTDFAFFQENINATVYPFSSGTGILHEDMACEFTSTDAHTLRDIRRELNKWSVTKTGSAIHTPRTRNIIQYVSQYPIQSLDLDYGVSDRVKFRYRMQSNPLRETREYTFFVSGEGSISFIDNNLYPAWFVVDGYYWVDFALESGNASWSVDQVNATTYAVTLKSKDTDLSFRSLGIVNTNTQSQYITVVPRGALDADAILLPLRCPENLNQVLLFIFLMTLMIGLAVVSMVFGNPWGTILGGIGILVLAMNLVFCETSIGIILIVVSFVIIGLGFSLRRAKDWLVDR